MKKLLNIVVPYSPLLIILFLFLFKMAQADYAIYEETDLSVVCDVPVLRVVDGDTFKAQTVTIISPSVKSVELTSFRLLGINTPEKKEPGYQEAKEYLHNRIVGKLVNIQLTLAKKKRDSFGRYLAYVNLCTKAGIVSMNVEMLQKGLAKEYKK